MNIAIYCRTSDSDVEEIIRQEFACRDFLKINMIYGKIDVYIDCGFSGFKNNRYSFNLILKKVRKSELDMIVVDSCDRFHKDPSTLNDFYNRLKDINTNFKMYSISECEIQGKIPSI